MGLLSLVFCLWKSQQFQLLYCMFIMPCYKSNTCLNYVWCITTICKKNQKFVTNLYWKFSGMKHFHLFPYWSRVINNKNKNFLFLVFLDIQKYYVIPRKKVKNIHYPPQNHWSNSAPQKSNHINKTNYQNIWTTANIWHTVKKSITTMVKHTPKIKWASKY